MPTTKKTAEPDTEEAPESPGRWHVMADGSAHLMKSKTTTLCGIKSADVVTNVGTLPEGRRPPCEGCAKKG